MMCPVPVAVTRYFFQVLSLRCSGKFCLSVNEEKKQEGEDTGTTRTI